MASDALAGYNEQLEYNLSEEGQFTETGVYDPSGIAEDITGIFDDHTFRGEKDPGNSKSKLNGARFVVYEIVDFDIELNIEFTIRGETYEIDYVEKDKQGAQVLWLL